MEDIQKAGNECRYGKIPGLKKNSFTHDLWHSHWSDDRRKKYR